MMINYLNRNCRIKKNNFQGNDYPLTAEKLITGFRRSSSFFPSVNAVSPFAFRGNRRTIKLHRLPTSKNWNRNGMGGGFLIDEQTDQLLKIERNCVRDLWKYNFGIDRILYYPKDIEVYQYSVIKLRKQQNIAIYF